VRELSSGLYLKIEKLKREKLESNLPLQAKEKLPNQPISGFT
jgi:hypothetical protein